MQLLILDVFYRVLKTLHYVCFLQELGLECSSLHTFVWQSGWWSPIGRLSVFVWRCYKQCFVRRLVGLTLMTLESWERGCLSECYSLFNRVALLWCHLMLLIWGTWHTRALCYGRGTARCAMLVNSCCVLRGTGVRKVSISKRGIQGHSRALAMMPFDRPHTISC